MPEINLGQEYRDAVTGVSGVASARTTYLHGDPRVCLEYANAHGEPKTHYVDEAQCVPLGTPPPAPEDVLGKTD